MRFKGAFNGIIGRFFCINRLVVGKFRSLITKEELGYDDSN